MAKILSQYFCPYQCLWWCYHTFIYNKCKHCLQINSTEKALKSILSHTLLIETQIKNDLVVKYYFNTPPPSRTTTTNIQLIKALRLCSIIIVIIIINNNPDNYNKVSAVHAWTSNDIKTLY